MDGQTAKGPVGPVRGPRTGGTGSPVSRAQHCPPRPSGGPCASPPWAQQRPAPWVLRPRARGAREARVLPTHPPHLQCWPVGWRGPGHGGSLLAPSLTPRGVVGPRGTERMRRPPCEGLVPHRAAFPREHPSAPGAAGSSSPQGHLASCCPIPGHPGAAHCPPGRPRPDSLTRPSGV